MKTRYALALAGLLCSSMLFSQVEGFRTGTRIGLGESRLSSTRYSETPRGKLHIQAGGLMVYGFNKWLGLRGDLGFSYTSSIAKGVTNNVGIFSGTYPFTDEYRFFNINLPLGLRLSAAGETFRPYAEMGISLQANLFGTEKRTYDDGSVNDDHGYGERKMTTLNPLSQDFFFGLGSELVTKQGKAFFLEVRLYSPLNAIGTVDQHNLNLNVLSIGGGVIFD